MVTVLGIYSPPLLLASTHEGSALIVRDGKLIAAIEEDRITRTKHDGRILLWNSIREVMRISGVEPNEIDAVAVPWEKPSDTLLHAIRGFKPSEAFSYPYLRLNAVRTRSMLERFGIEAPVWHVNHHQSHAVSAHLTSGLRDCSVITLDGQGDRNESLSAWHVQNNEMKRIVMVDAPTFGDFYSAATNAIGFKIDDGEGKTMGLASYGTAMVAYDQVKKFGAVRS